MPPVKECTRCGGDVALGHKCPRCEPARRAARRHPGYNDPCYIRYRARKKRGHHLCERCGHATARPGAILHHNDGNPGNNPADGSNYTWACAECAAVLDAQMRTERRAARQDKRSPWK